MADESSVFYVGISDAHDVRRGILESQKDVLQNLKRYEEYAKIREMKSLMMKEFSKVISEINLLNSKLKKSLPNAGIRAQPSFIAVKKKTVLKIAKQEKPDKMKSLQKELDDIEGKLGELMER